MKLGIVTDLHLTDPLRPPARFHNQYDFANSQANALAGLQGHVDAGVDAIAVLGDLTNNGDAVHHQQAIVAFQATSLPVWVVPGNHDCEEAHDALDRRVAASGSGNPLIPNPVGFSFNGWWIAGLPVTRFDTERKWHEAVPALDRWGDGPTVLLTHAPIFSLAEVTAKHGLPYAGDLSNRADLADVLRTRQAPTIVLHGHLHLRYTHIEGEALQIGFGAMIEPPHAIATVEVADNDGDLTVDVRHGSVAPYQMERSPIVSPDVERFRFRDGRWQRIATAGG